MKTFLFYLTIALFGAGTATAAVIWDRWRIKWLLRIEFAKQLLARYELVEFTGFVAREKQDVEKDAA